MRARRARYRPQRRRGPGGESGAFAEILSGIGSADDTPHGAGRGANDSWNVRRIRLLWRALQVSSRRERYDLARALVSVLRQVAE